MVDVTDLNAVIAEVPKARKAFLRARDVLAGCIGQPAEVADHVLSCAAEFGPEEALRLLAKAPETFDISSPQTHRTVKDALLAAHAAEQNLDSLTVIREHGMIAKDPAHRQVFNHLGVEFTVDTQVRTMTYVATGETRAVEYTSSVPEPEPEPDMSPRPGRKR